MGLNLDRAFDDPRILAEALDLTDDGILSVDAGGRTTFVNEAALALLQRLQGIQAPAKPAFAAFSFRDRDGHSWPADSDPLSRALRGEAVGTVVAIAPAAEGDLPVRLKVNPVRGDDGRVVGAVCAMQVLAPTGDWQRLVAELPDCPDREELQAELVRLSRAVEEQVRWRTTVASMLEAVTICDAEGRVTYINPAYERLIGRTVGDGVSLAEHPAYYQLYHVDGTLFAPNDLPLQRAALHGEDVRDVEIVHRASDGHEFIGVFSASPVRDDDGRIVGAVAVGRDVTALRKAEAEASLTEERYSLLFANSIDAVLLTAPDGTILDANPAAEAMFGLSKEELRRAGRAGIVDTSDPRLGPALEERARTGSVRSELTCIRRDGTRFEAEVSSVLFRDNRGSLRTSMIIRDLSEREKAARELAMSEARYRALFESLSEGLGVHEMIFAADGTASDYRFLQVNAAFEAITGLRREDVLGHTVREVLPDIEQFWIDRYGEVVRTGAPTRFESYAGPLGKHFEVIAYATGPGQFATLFIDVSERKRGEAERERLLAQVESQRERAEEKAVEALRANAQFNALLENLREAVVVADAKGNVILRNQMAREVTGLSDDRSQAVLQHRATIKAFHPDGRPMPESEQGLLKVLKGEDVTGQEMILERPDGTQRWLLISGSTVRNEREEIELGIVVYSDVTAIRQAEQAREEFISLAAHELKTPLTAIIGYVQLLNRQGGHDDRERESFRVLRSQSERMARIVQGMLSMAQLRSGGLQLSRVRCDLARIVRGVVRAAGPEAPMHALRHVADGPLWVDADPEQVSQVLASLIENAVKYSPEGGPVVVTVRQSEGEAVVAVRDEGMGIAPEHQKRLFEPFFQAAPMTRPTTGMGLGLYIGREIVRLHGGRMWFESVPHAGSTFYFTLPLAKPGA